MRRRAGWPPTSRWVSIRQPSPRPGAAHQPCLSRSLSLLLRPRPLLSPQGPRLRGRSLRRRHLRPRSCAAPRRWRCRPRGRQSRAGTPRPDLQAKPQLPRLRRKALRAQFFRTCSAFSVGVAVAPATPVRSRHRPRLERRKRPFQPVPYARRLPLSRWRGQHQRPRQHSRRSQRHLRRLFRPYLAMLCQVSSQPPRRRRLLSHRRRVRRASAPSSTPCSATCRLAIPCLSPLRSMPVRLAHRAPLWLSGRAAHGSMLRAVPARRRASRLRRAASRQ